MSDNYSEGANGEDLSPRFPQGVREGFLEIPSPQNQPGDNRWALTDHADIGPNSYWVQVIMTDGDPAWRWRDPLSDEMLEHVIVPVLSLVAPLTLALLLTTRRELRPLERVSRQVEALAHAVRTGSPIAPLAEENLPLEVSRFVAAINTMLASLQRSLKHQRQFTSDAAHELRTPLAVLALELSELPPSPLAERLTTEIRALANLVNQLLRLAQAEDLMMSDCQDADIVKISRDVCEDLVTEAIARRLSRRGHRRGRAGQPVGCARIRHGQVDDASSAGGCGARPDMVHLDRGLLRKGPDWKQHEGNSDESAQGMSFHEVSFLIAAAI